VDHSGNDSDLTVLSILDLDFLSVYDLFTACFILQKQIEHIYGNEENIIIPSVKMKEIRERPGMCVFEWLPYLHLFF
jgi:hypothetical protein